MPAQLLEKTAPAFRKKGRLQVGMDADISVFAPATIKAKTTYEKPHQASSGMAFVLVDGQLVIKDGKLQKGGYPGKQLFGKTKEVKQ